MSTEGTAHGLTAHDSICPAHSTAPWWPRNDCCCPQIDRARADERECEARRMNERWRTQVLDNERDRMRLDLLADLRANVGTLPAWDPVSLGVAYIKRDDVLDLIDGGSDE